MSLIDRDQKIKSYKQFSRIAFKRELLVASQFGLIGVISTAVHIFVVWLLLRQTEMSPIAANTLAFLTAFGVSFAGNYLWTFRSPGNPNRAILRFFIVAVGAFIGNTIMLTFLIRGEWFSPVVSAIFSASVVPIISFLASRNWVFKKFNDVSK